MSTSITKMTSWAFLVVISSVCFTGVLGQYGREVGEFSTLAHGVMGKVFAVSENHIHIVNFNYDGQGPAAYFYGGTSRGRPDSRYSGMRIPHNPSNRNQRLPAYENKALTIQMPRGLKVQHLKWLSVWCVDFSVSFGQVTFTDGFEVPKPQAIGTFSTLAHGVSSGRVTVLDTKTVKIEHFTYDGMAPDAYFIAGQGDKVGVNNGTIKYYKLTDQDDKLLQSAPIANVTLTLTFRNGGSIKDVDYISMWCVPYQQDFGNVRFNPATLSGVPPALPIIADKPREKLPNCETLLQGEFNVGWEINDAHIILDMSSTIGRGRYMAFGISGSDHRFRMIGSDVIVAQYDNNEMPIVQDYSLKGYFECQNGNGVCPDDESGGSQDISLISSSVENGIFKVRVMRRRVTGDSNDKTYLVNEAQQVVWAMGDVNDENQIKKHDFRITENKAMNFGRPGEDNCQPLRVPERNCETLLKDQFNIGWEIHNDYIVLDMESTIGEGKYAAFGLSGSTDGYRMIGSDVIVAQYDNNKMPIAQDYSLKGYFECQNGNGVCPDDVSGGSQDIDLISSSVLNGIFKVKVIRRRNTGDPNDKVYLSNEAQQVVWAIGDVNDENQIIKHDLRITENKAMNFGRPGKDNCQPLKVPERNCETLLKDQFNIGWEINQTHIVLEMMSTIGKDRYMAFGLSGQPGRLQMIGADVIVARYDNNRMPIVEDYALKGYALCSNGNGVCRDDRSGGTQDVSLISATVSNGIFKVTVVRRRNTGDPDDKIYERTRPQQIVWAMGGVNTQSQVTKHDKRITANKVIHFGRSPKDNCQPLKVSAVPEDTVKWTETRIANTREFRVVMGPTGGNRGYKAITGKQSWGIAFYINGYLIPHLELTRGTTYTFTVETGNQPDGGNAEYHPFYLTTDPRGGYVQLSQIERERYPVFVGLDRNGIPSQSAVGRFCEYQLTDFNTVLSETFDEFKKNLRLNCKDDSGQAGTISFTPDDTTPDTLYYQCYTHYNLGWKISIVDAPTVERATINKWLHPFVGK